METFNIGRVDDARAILCVGNQVSQLLGVALSNASLNLQPGGQAALNELHDGYFRLDVPEGRTGLTKVLHPMWIKGLDITRQAIHRQQQQAAQGHLPHLVCHPLQQPFIALRANHATLHLALDLIGLHLL